MIVFGIEGHAYLNSTPDSAIGAAGWIDLTIVRNVSVAREMKEVDVTTRASLYELTDMRLTNAVIQLELPLDPLDAGYQALETAYVNKASVSLAVLSGAITAYGSRGPVGTFNITAFDREENLDGAIMMKATAKPLRNICEYVALPAAPTGVSAALVGGCIDVYETPNANHDGVRLYYSTDDGNTWTLYTLQASAGNNWIRLMKTDGSGASALGPGTYVFRLTSAGQVGNAVFESVPTAPTNSVTLS
jgi:hypothetical protein